MSDLFIGENFWVNLNETKEETKSRQAQERASIKRKHALELAHWRGIHKAERAKLEEHRGEKKKKEKLSDPETLLRARRRELRIEVQILRKKNKAIARECFLQLSQLQRHDLQERKTIIEAFRQLKKLNSTRIKAIAIELDPSLKIRKPRKVRSVRSRKTVRKSEAELKRLLKECVEKGIILPFNEISEICGFGVPDSTRQ